VNLLRGDYEEEGRREGGRCRFEEPMKREKGERERENFLKRGR
jgi:hypothetical protein